MSCRKGTRGLSVREALDEGAHELARAGCDEPRLDAEILLSHVLRIGRASLFAHPERRLAPEEEGAWLEALARRLGREPAAYILGRKEFYGLDFLVDPRVLVPRPETELLVERVVGLARQRLVQTLWDVGTGSGALALTLARHLPEARIVASDVSSEALEVAAINRRRLGLERRVQLVRADLLQAARGAIDVVVANLPYLRTDEYCEAMSEVSRHEPRLALDGGVTGLEIVARLLAQARALEPPPGVILLEIGARQGAQALALARAHFPERPLTLRRDLAGLDRVVEIQSDCGRGGEEGEGTHILPADDPQCIAVAAAALRRGEVVAFPTDTVYGLGAALFCEPAVQALYEIKGRPEMKAIPVLLASADDLAQVVAHVSPLAERLRREFWPGPLTLVLGARPDIPPVVRAGGQTVAVRVPDHPVAQALIRALGTPLAATSANRSAAPEALTAAEVVEQLGNKVRWVIDGGRSPGGRPSTVVDVTVSPPAIRRVGAISEETLQPYLSARMEPHCKEH